MSGAALKIAVLGGGAWGTALAVTMARAGLEPALWARDAATVAEINNRRTNSRYLPGITLQPGIAATADAAEALRQRHVVVHVPGDLVGVIAADRGGVAGNLLEAQAAVRVEDDRVGRVVDLVHDRIRARRLQETIPARQARHSGRSAFRLRAGR